MVVTGEGLEFRHFLLGHRPGFAGQFIEESEHLVDTASHFGGQRAFGVVIETEQLRQGMAALENLRHHRGIVPGATVRPQIGGPGDKGLVDFPAQLTVVTVGHYRVEAGEIQGDNVAVQLPLPGSLAGPFEGGFGQTGQFVHVGDLLVPVLGGIQHVIAETIGQFGQLPGQVGILLFWSAGRSTPPRWKSRRVFSTALR